MLKSSFKRCVMKYGCMILMGLLISSAASESFAFDATNVGFVSANAFVQTDAITGNNFGEYQIHFSVTVPDGGQDLYIGRYPFFMAGTFAQVTSSDGNYRTVPETQTASAVFGSTVGDSVNWFKIQSGDTRDFRFIADFAPPDSGFYAYQIHQLAWTNDPASGTISRITLDPATFSTPFVFLNVVPEPASLSLGLLPCFILKRRRF